MEACIVGQAVPIVTRGIFLLNGVTVDDNDGSGVSDVAMDAAWLAAGGVLYAGTDGGVTSSSVDTNSDALEPIGRALGLPSGGDILIKLEL